MLPPSLVPSSGPGLHSLVSSGSELSAPHWVLITGASSGIGRALVHEFARNGHSVVLVGRDPNSLGRLAQICERHYQVRAVCIEADLTRAGSCASVVDSVRARGITIETLVNNAGFGVHGPFSETPLLSELEMIEIQISAMVRLTKAFLPGMLKQRCGRILNVASVYSFSPVPFQSVYGASKSFMFSFSQGLLQELRDTGVTVTTLCPGITRTNFRRRAGMREKKTFLSMSSREVAHFGYEAAMKGRALAIPGYVNRLFAWGARFLPPSAISLLLTTINRLRGVGRPS